MTVDEAISLVDTFGFQQVVARTDRKIHVKEKLPPRPRVSVPQGTLPELQEKHANLDRAVKLLVNNHQCPSRISFARNMKAALKAKIHELG